MTSTATLPSLVGRSLPELPNLEVDPRVVALDNLRQGLVRTHWEGQLVDKQRGRPTQLVVVTVTVLPEPSKLTLPTRS